MALSSPQAEGGGSHTAKGVCEAAARVWGAAEPAHQGGPAWFRVSVPLGLYPTAPHPTPLGTHYPIVSAGSPPQPLFPPTLLPSQGTPAFLFAPWIPLSRDLHPTDVQRLPSLSLREVTGGGDGEGAGACERARRLWGEKGRGLDPLASLPPPQPIRSLVSCPRMGAAEAALVGGALAA